MQRVTQAAIQSGDGTVHTLPRPARHHDIVRKMYEGGYRMDAEAEQGFVLEDETFVDRETAADFALASRQIKELQWPPNLYSEDLW